MAEMKRQTELDILRLLALLAVIMMHAGGNKYLSTNFDSNGHSMFIAAIVWSVPVFFMISGRFFLDPQRNITIERIWNKYVRHIVVVFLVWTSVYTLYYVKSGAYDSLIIWGILTQWIDGPYHFWYLYALVGLYMFSPLLRRLTENEKAMMYFLMLFGISNIIGEYLVYLPKIGGIIGTAYDKLWLNHISGYVGYYVLGYCIYHYKNQIKRKLESAIYVVGGIALLATIVLEGHVSPELQTSDFIKQYLKPNVILFSSAIYLFFVKRVSRITFSDRIIKLFQKLTELGFGVYILHALINEFLSFIPITQPLSHPYFFLLVVTAAIYFISLSCTWLIRKIPVVGKWIT